MLEHCAGGDLFKALIVGGKVADEQWACIKVIAPLLRLLEKMHRLSIGHRNINPENIFLTSRCALRLGDFGLAVDFGRKLSFARVGTPDYMAPEVLRNPKAKAPQEAPAVTLAELTARGIVPYHAPAADVWAVGVLAYELVTGRPPFASDDADAQAELIMSSSRIAFPPDKSAAWADFVRRALTKDPMRRPTAYELLGHPFITGGIVSALRSPQGQAGNREQLLASLLRALPLPRTRLTLAAASVSSEPTAALWAAPGVPFPIVVRSLSADGAALTASMLCGADALPTRASTWDGARGSGTHSLLCSSRASTASTASGAPSPLRLSRASTNSAASGHSGGGALPSPAAAAEAPAGAR